MVKFLAPATDLYYLPMGESCVARMLDLSQAGPRYKAKNKERLPQEIRSSDLHD